MCGIFGAIGNNISEPLLNEIAMQARKRGPHAWGIAWLDGTYNRFCDKGRGTFPLQKLPVTSEIRAIIGHCRMSTSGRANDMANNQPIIAGNVSVAHNGNISYYEQQAYEMGLTLTTKCDSEVIARVAERDGIQEAMMYAMTQAPTALLILRDKTIYAYHKGLPLYMMELDGTTYFCSRPFLGASEVEEGVTIAKGTQTENRI